MDLDISLDYNIYCFDIFDTILTRTVAPEYVKKIWAKEIKDYFEISILSEDIYKLRSRIEAELCHKNLEEGNDLEFRLDCLYDIMYDKLNLGSLVDKLILNGHYMRWNWRLKKGFRNHVTIMLLLLRG